MSGRCLRVSEQRSQALGQGPGLAMRPSLAPARIPAQELRQAQREGTVAKHMGQRFVPRKYLIVDSKTSPSGVLLPKTKAGDS